MWGNTCRYSIFHMHTDKVCEKHAHKCQNPENNYSLNTKMWNYYIQKVMQEQQKRAGNWGGGGCVCIIIVHVCMWEFIHTLLMHTLRFYPSHNLGLLDSLHACSYSLLSIFGRRIAGIGCRCCARVHVCCGTGSTPRAQLFQCTGSSYGPDDQARLSLQVKTLQVPHHSISTHLKYLKSYFPL